MTIAEVASGELVVKSDGGYLIGLDGTLDEELVAEGIARELVNRVQRLRRDVGLPVADRIDLGIRGAEEIERAAETHADYIAGETLAVQVDVGSSPEAFSGDWNESEIDGLSVRIGLTIAR